MIRDIFKLMRIKHWVKNGLIFLPLFFAKEIFNVHNFLITFLAFLSFSFAASAVYIINDLNDIEKDKKHPKKCNRPLASGRITKGQAFFMLIFLVLLCILLNYLASSEIYISWILLILYVISNLCYSMGMKNIALIDLFILILGYILRLYYGAVIGNIEVSSWLYLTIMAAAFFMSLGKRRNELIRLGPNAKTRKVLEQYTKDFLDKSMYMALGLTITFYSLWSEELSRVSGNSLILFTIPLVILICMRYILLVEGDSDGDPIEVLIEDKSLIGLVLTYIIILIVILY